MFCVHVRHTCHFSSLLLRMYICLCVYIYYINIMIVFATPTSLISNCMSAYYPHHYHSSLNVAQFPRFLLYRLGGEGGGIKNAMHNVYVPWYIHYCSPISAFFFLISYLPEGRMLNGEFIQFILFKFFSYSIYPSLLMKCFLIFNVKTTEYPIVMANMHNTHTHTASK